ncbi:hypothetical protein [Brevibacillus massiliensis]|uniref:hypothetical protein n=1 Tax=Brevibacillus massiliensis TaxID=1118054 RepID=UPI0002D35F65|nr:hypothetical protein [Brevibacillus massiliensis]
MKSVRTSLTAGIIIGGMIFASQAWADVAGAPGSADDPVVTKSYVDQKIREALGGAAPVGGGVTNSGGTAAAGLEVVELPPGKILYGFEGTEFIVRTGNVLSVAGVNGDGLTDLTAGADLRAGDPVEHNHLLLIPRSDSRGLQLVPGSKAKTYVIVRGKYELK